MSKNKVKSYSSYKHSGEVWIGDVPEHWDIKPGFTVIEERSEKNKGMIECTVLTLSYGQVKIKPEEKLTGLVPESFETYQIVYPGDIIIRPTDLQNDKTSLRTGLAKDKGIITSAYINLKVKNNYSSKYFHYYLHLVDITKMIYGLGTGLRQNLGFGEFKRFNFLVPPSQEQTAISEFLDKKTALIDQAISIKEKQIELLKERKQILIQKAVTRGLNPKVKFKDSGVEWIGEIPEHWNLKCIKYLKANIKNAFVDGPFGSNLKSEHFIEGGDVYVVESGFITTGVFINKVFKTISENHYQTIKRSSCKEGDVIIAKIGANYGMAAELPYLDKKSVVSGNSLKITLNNNIILNTLFVKLLGLSKQIGGFEEIVNASAQPALSLGGLNNLKLPVAPINEQKEIVSYIDNVDKLFIESISLKEQEIEKLKEYKSTLINSAVTGKIKVC